MTYETLRIFQIATELWGTLICLFGLTVIITNRHLDVEIKRNKIVLELFCIIMMVGDALTYMYSGKTGNTAYYVERISQFLVYHSVFSFWGVFTGLNWLSIFGGKRKKNVVVRFIYAINIIGIVFLIISQYTGWFYSFDSDNVMVRGNLYSLFQIIGIVTLVVNIILIIYYRSNIKKNVFITMMVYFVLPLFAVFLMTWLPGYSFLNIALVLATQFTFVVDRLNQNQVMVERNREFEKASYEAEHDRATGLFNKVSGINRIGAHIDAMDTGDNGTLVFMDIDDFKNINDSYGHDVGDFWIKQIAELLMSVCYRKDDVVCRFGGDEYLIYLKGLDDRTVIEGKIYQFSDLLKDICAKQGQTVKCSAGICLIHGEGHNVQECMKIADDALYKMKKNGKDGCVICNTDNDMTYRITSAERAESEHRAVVKAISGILYDDKADVDGNELDNQFISMRDINGFVNLLPEQVFVMDTVTRRILFANNTFCEKIGIDLKSLVGRFCYDVLPADVYYKVICAGNRAQDKPCSECVFANIANTGSRFLKTDPATGRNYKVCGCCAKWMNRDAMVITLEEY